MCKLDLHASSHIDGIAPCTVKAHLVLELDGVSCIHRDNTAIPVISSVVITSQCFYTIRSFSHHLLLFVLLSDSVTLFAKDTHGAPSRQTRLPSALGERYLLSTFSSAASQLEYLHRGKHSRICNSLEPHIAYTMTHQQATRLQSSARRVWQ